MVEVVPGAELRLADSPVVMFTMVEAEGVGEVGGESLGGAEAAAHGLLHGRAIAADVTRRPEPEVNAEDKRSSSGVDW